PDGMGQSGTVAHRAAQRRLDHVRPAAAGSVVHRATAVRLRSVAGFVYGKGTAADRRAGVVSGVARGSDGTGIVAAVISPAEVPEGHPGSRGCFGPQITQI